MVKQKMFFSRKDVEGMCWRAYLVGKTNYKGIDFAEWLVMEFSLLDTEDLSKKKKELKK